MTTEKFSIEVDTLKKFFELYCKDKHQNQEAKSISLSYKNKNMKIQLNLCEDCFNSINYSFSKLQECPHDIKPRCRKCPNPCYDKPQWKKTAKVMIYAALKLNLSIMKNKMKKLFS